MHLNRFPLELCPDLAGGAYRAPHAPSWNKGDISKGREWCREGKGVEGGEAGRGKGMRWEGR